MAQRILVVDDDPHILEVISFALKRAGFETIAARDGQVALASHTRSEPDLIVLDINLPEMDGLEVCRNIRKTSDVPILFLSSRDDEIDRVLGLEIGGDDYVSKPFSPRELVARVKVILKRSQSVQPEIETKVLESGSVSLWSDQHKVHYRDIEISLTATEFRILKTFLARPDRVCDRNAVIDMAYGPNMHVSDRTIDSHIRHIRVKFQDAGCENVIETLHGVGYKLGDCR